MVGRRGLWILDIAGIACQVPLLQHLDECVPVDNPPVCCIDQVGALFHPVESFAVEQPAAQAFGVQAAQAYDAAIRYRQPENWVYYFLQTSSLFRGLTELRRDY